MARQRATPTWSPRCDPFEALPLQITERTVRKHVGDIFRRLKVDTRVCRDAVVAHLPHDESIRTSVGPLSRISDPCSTTSAVSQRCRIYTEPDPCRASTQVDGDRSSPFVCSQDRDDRSKGATADALDQRSSGA